MVLAGRERSILGRHQWIFSGAVKKMPTEAEDGSCVDVVSVRGEFLASAFLNRKSSIVGRIISFEKRDAEEAIRQNIENAITYRRKLFGNFSGKMFRLINAEADMLSGLVVDLYDTSAVIQVSSLGIEKHKEIILDALRAHIPLTWIYEKSTSPSRKQEGLSPCERTLWGEEKPTVVVEEEGIRYMVAIKEGQKTGFFLDQREMRTMIQQLAKGRKVVNCFSYSGGFSLSALLGGASSCLSIDSSSQALTWLGENLRLNGLEEDTRHSSLCTDVFSWLEKEDVDFDLVILDPPAFAKRKQDLDKALRGYKEINRRALQKMPKNSFLLTSSCSYHVEPTQFMAMLKKAALDAGRNVRILSYHRHAWDHPTSIFHPETDYLKSALLYVE
jgi:23S rRNA (cytosine1962-C5)-methyltransferase